jgi:hypothetical protein
MATGTPDREPPSVEVSHVAYESPGALSTRRSRIEWRMAAQTSPYNIAELRRHIAYDRLLARVFLDDPDGWVLKGGTGLLVRINGVARTWVRFLSSSSTVTSHSRRRPPTPEPVPETPNTVRETDDRSRGEPMTAYGEFLMAAVRGTSLVVLFRGSGEGRQGLVIRSRRSSLSGGLGHHPFEELVE